MSKFTNSQKQAIKKLESLKSSWALDSSLKSVDLIKFDQFTGSALMSMKFEDGTDCFVYVRKGGLITDIDGNRLGNKNKIERLPNF